MNQSLNDSTIVVNETADTPEAGSLLGQFRNKMQTHTNVKRIESFNMDEQSNGEQPNGVQPNSVQPKTEQINGVQPKIE